MKRIKKHLYCKENQTAVYAEPSFLKVVGYLSEGQWLGLLEETDDYSFIISNKLTGYIPSNSYTQNSPELYNFHFENSTYSYHLN